MVNVSLKKLDNITKKGDTYPIETKYTNEIKIMEIISRKEAKEQGLMHYFTGKPCKHGHVAERPVSSGQCCECARKWRKENKGKVIEHQRKYYEENKEKVTEKNRKYHEQNKENILEKKRKYHKENREKVTEKYRKWRKANPEKVAEKDRKWREANPEQVFIRNSLCRIQDNWKGSRAKAEILLGYTCEQLKQHIESQLEGGMSWNNRSDWHIDHIKPVSAFLKEGITDPAIINALDNLQPLWAHENLSKGAKYDG